MEINEKKLTDEELITALDKCREKTYCEEKCEYRLAEMGSACIPKLMGQALDLIRRLQYGYSSASKASDEWREKYEAVLKDYYAERQTCDEQKDIIERLTKWYDTQSGLYNDLQDENKELKAEIERLKTENGNQVRMRCDMQRKFDDLQTLCAEQKAEIERLTEENAILKENPTILAGRSLGKTIRAKLLAFDKMKEQNAELQKQVDVLTAEKENLYFLNKNLEDYIDNHEPIWKRNTEQAVKDTAKEILQDLLKWLNQSISFSNGKSLNGSIQYGAMNKAYHEVKRRVKKIAESKGVEVEQ